MLSSQDAKELVATQRGVGIFASLSFGLGCALLYVGLFVESDDKFGLTALCYGTPLVYALVGCSVGSAANAFAVSTRLYGYGAAVSLSLLATVPGIGLVVAVVLARKTAAFFRSSGLQLGRCGVCGRHFVETNDARGVCLECLSGIQ